MRIAEETAERLVLNDLALGPAALIGLIGVMWAGLGFTGAVLAEDPTTRLVMGAFAAGSILILGFALYAARRTLHVFDRGRNLYRHRASSLFGTHVDRRLPLDRVLRMAVEREEDRGEGDTFYLVLEIAREDGRTAGMRMLHYGSADRPKQGLVHHVNRWLGQG